MIKFEDALTLIASLASECPLEEETISLENADGRICCKNIFSPEAVPPFDNSAMDGFAICSSDTRAATAENPICLSVSSLVAAGDAPESYHSDVRAIEIMTGAPVPEGFDTVVRLEDVEIKKAEVGQEDEIRLRKSVPKGNNIRIKGSDYEVGQKVLPQGARIKAESMMALASLGISEVSVFKMPVAAILATGKELVPFQSEVLKAGKIRNSTSVYLKTALGHLGVKLAKYEVIGDEPEDFKIRVREILEQSVDVLITTGAVSMGRYDFIVSSLTELGAKIVFHKVAIRPGKPILLAKIPRDGRKPLVVFGMPGNPVSTAVGVRFFLTPFLRGINRQKREQGMQVRLDQTTPKPEGLSYFLKGCLRHGASGVRVQALSGQASFMVSSLVQANAWIHFQEERERIEKDETVLVFPLLPDQSFEMGIHYESEN